jgi:hypothetical protein
VLIQFARSLGIDGEKYCQAVLDKAEPKRSVHLFVT